MNAIDTNVLIYFYDERDTKKRGAATDLIKSLRDGVMLWQVACEFMSASHRLAASGLTSDIAWQRLAELLQLFHLMVPTPGVLERAPVLSTQRQTQFWDTMIYAACLEAGVNRLYSEDVPGSVIPGLEVINPFQ